MKILISVLVDETDKGGSWSFVDDVKRVTMVQIKSKKSKLGESKVI